MEREGAQGTQICIELSYFHVVIHSNCSTVTTPCNVFQYVKVNVINIAITQFYKARSLH